MRPEALENKLYLWWLADPQHPRCIGTLRLVRKAQMQSAGVALRYGSDWLQTGFALSEDLPLRDVEFLPTVPDQPAPPLHLRFFIFCRRPAFWCAGCVGVAASLCALCAWCLACLG
jgi:hypothetical protein